MAAGGGMGEYFQILWLGGVFSDFAAAGWKKGAGEYSEILRLRWGRSYDWSTFRFCGCGDGGGELWVEYC